MHSHQVERELWLARQQMHQNEREAHEHRQVRQRPNEQRTLSGWLQRLGIKPRDVGSTR